MADIIDLEKRKQSEQKQKADEKRHKLIDRAVQVMQCSQCPRKCVKCGEHMNPGARTQSSRSIPYNLCPHCQEDYYEFLEKLHGRGNPDYYWQNSEWMEVWKAWMHYQDALRRFQVSDEAKKLVNEFKDG